MQVSNFGKSRAGFTLVELLVVIAIIGILVGLLLPAVQQIREAARRTQCLNNLKQLGLAVHVYEGAFGGFPEARWSPNGASNHPIPPAIGAGNSFWKSWSVSILPFVEQQAVSDLFNQKLAWFDPVNLEAVKTPLAVFVCPSAPDALRMDEYHVRGAAAGDYGCINEVHKRVFEEVLVPPQFNTRVEDREGPLVKQRRMKMRDIVDGLSNTIMLAESAGKPTAWLAIGKMTPPSFALYNDDKVILHNGVYITNDGTGWADPDSGFTVNGATADGLKKYGPVMINAINASEVFAFHVLNVEEKWVGVNTRMLQIDLVAGRQQQFVYQLENPKHKLHEILAVDSGRFLVIEQDGLGGDLARFKQIVLIETGDATPLPEDSALPPDHLPDNIRPVRKVRTLDLLDPAFGLAGPGMPEKIEGLCFGPTLPDGRRILVIATDNDFRTDQDSMFYVFAVSL